MLRILKDRAYFKNLQYYFIGWECQFLKKAALKGRGPSFSNKKKGKKKKVLLLKKLYKEVALYLVSAFEADV
jgi:hypothetical protein